MTTWTGTASTVPAAMTTGLSAALATYRDAIKAASEAWTTWTPVWTATSVNPAIGNGTLAGRYKQVNKHIEGWARITMGGSTTYGTGFWKISLPVAPHSGHPCHFDVFLTDTSGSVVYRGVSYAPSGSVVALAYDANGASNTSLGGVTPTTPFTWATTDVLEVQFSYEGA